MSVFLAKRRGVTTAMPGAGLNLQWPKLKHAVAYSFK
jgi:hypothetical protein